MLIHVPKYQDSFIELPRATSKMRAEVKLRKYKADNLAVCIGETDWIPNLLTDRGVPRIVTTSGFANYCWVGSSSQAATILDESLVSPIARHNIGTPSGTVSSVDSLDDYRHESIFGYRWNAGVATGTVREVGVTDSSSTTVCTSNSRVVVPDFPVASDEVLDVYYKFHWYPFKGDVVGQVDISGVTYDYTLRSSSASYNWGSINRQFAFTSSSAYHYAYSGIIGDWLGNPAGTAQNGSSGTSAYLGYAGGVATHSCDITWGLDDANYAGGIRSIRFMYPLSYTQVGFQIQFDNAIDGTAIPKDNTKILTVGMQAGIARV